MYIDTNGQEWRDAVKPLVELMCREDLGHLTIARDGRSKRVFVMAMSVDQVAELEQAVESAGAENDEVLNADSLEIDEKQD